ncbi:helix-turn-helix domain-containing protein [Streptomyces sp. NPDC052043]|uniref:helix-turn-helix domain-containing protein n=1 Tax=Streptomyces sp. NPDC052043 TaxID=3365684 RepID=UPI0037D3AD6B
MSERAPNQARVIPLRPPAARPGPSRPEPGRPAQGRTPAAAPREPLWRDLVGDVLRRERQAQERTLKDVADAARISMPYLSEIERGRKEASSEVLAAAARALGIGLGDLLSHAQDELARTAARGAVHDRGTSVPRYDGMCLAA